MALRSSFIKPMRRTLTIRVDGRNVQFDSIWSGRDELAPWPDQVPPPDPSTYCPDCWYPLPPGDPCSYCAELRRVKRIRKLLSTQRRGRRLRRRLIGIRSRCVDCAAKLPRGWRFRRCEGCRELARCWAGLSHRRIAAGLCYICGVRPQARHPNGRLSTRCERCLI